MLCFNCLFVSMVQIYDLFIDKQQNKSFIRCNTYLLDKLHKLVRTGF